MTTSVLLLCCAGAVQILQRGTILRVPRNALKVWLLTRATRSTEMDHWNRWDYLHELSECPMCLGFWVGWAATGSILGGCGASLVSLVADLVLAGLDRWAGSSGENKG